MNRRLHHALLMLTATLWLTSASQPAIAQHYTRGIGIYPGAPADYHGPAAKTSTALRNLALHRAARASSTADYNMTAHLVTDGICDDSTPCLLTVATPQGRLPRREAEWTVDGGPFSNQLLMGSRTWISYDWGAPLPLGAGRLRLDGRVAYRDEASTEGYDIVCETSEDGLSWTVASRLKGDGLPGQPMQWMLHSDPNKQTGNDYLPARVLDMTLSLPAEPFRHLRLRLEMEGAVYWNLNELHLADSLGQEQWAMSSQQFRSMWMSDGGGQQWIEVDLGAPARVERVVPHWVEEPRRWHHEQSSDGRTVRLVMDEPGQNGCYALRELEVWGTGGTDYEPGLWQLQRASEVDATGQQIATEGFDTSGWLPATVPGTVLTSFINIGAVPNPNYGDNADQISESYFRSNFWYRGTIEAPECPDGSVLLCLDGINWKARVFMNGTSLGTIEGAFRRGQFDVTGLLRPGKNYVAIEVVCNEHFAAVKEKDENTTQFNGGILGADNPTFHASVGWDWITTVRGREAGIWGPVHLTTAPGHITLSDPYVQTRLTADGEVSVTPSVFARNHGTTAYTGTLQGWIGDTRFERTVTLPANSETEITFSPDDYAQLTGRDFRLWWPNGYGEPYRYDAGYSLGGSSISYKAGLRQMTCEGLADSLRIFINGRRLVPLGGNWGFPEHNLQYGRREYAAAVGYHRDMHCTMIRNWVGQTADRAFYDACDSLGIMVWQDFWLANPADGPDPYDDQLFLQNAHDYLRRIRQHPAIALLCGRNEGYPPQNIDRQLRHYTATLTPGLDYISSSADDCVTGHGPYWALPAKSYFERQSGKIHTERGMPAVMNIESLRRTFEPDSLWPQSRQWGQHDYTLQGAQRAREFNALLEEAFGTSDQAETFSRRSQLINYNGYRAMFESASRARQGLLIWMSHPCWPSMVWQTYDYYLDPTAAYFGVKKACEPLHIQLNALTDSIEVVNLFAGEHRGLTATATLYDLQGRRLWSASRRTDSHNDTTLPLMALGTTGATEGRLLRLQLSSKGRLLSLNDYLLPDASGSYRELENGHPQLQQQLTLSHDGNTCRALLTVSNKGRQPAFLLRANLKGNDGEQILPAIYSDNYFNLLPGETRHITIEWKTEDSRDRLPSVEVTLLN